ncbi:MAG: hypothetical protein AAF223_00480, partial [Bacteroidota bacterium]
PQPLEGLLIAISAAWGSSIIIISASREFKLLAYFSTLILAPFFTFWLLVSGWWIPIISPGIAMVGASILTLVGIKSRTIRKLV